MKKLHFSPMAILFALFTMVSFTACSSDDDETPSTEDIKTNIIGMWQWTHVSGWDYDWRKRSIPTHSEWLYPLTFDAGKGLKEA